jgi:serine/threonine protein kinase
LIQARTKPIAIVQGSPLVEQACRKASFAALYDLGPEIGSGSTSTVHKSTQKASGKVFATKVVSAAGLQTPGVADQFASEVLALKRCRHPHVVSLEDAVVDENKLYLVTELLTGGELFDYVVKRGTLGEDEAASILSDVGDAIRFMHDQGVIHRDLKPENLLLAKESPVGFPTVKIIDFGLSKARATRDVCASFLGTRGYLAPEMLKRRTYSEAVDMWAFGVIAYVLLCGCLPFDDDAARINSPNASKKFELRFPSWARGLSKGARDLLANLLQVDPRRRYTAAQCCRHPWLRGTAERSSVPLSSPAMLGRRLAAARATPSPPSRPSSRAGPADYAVLDNDGRARPASRRKNSF